jgi:hypothetical protein
MTPQMAQQILRLGFAEADKVRMHALAVKNQEGVLSDKERQELDNYICTGDLIAILQSKARQSLNRPLDDLDGGRYRSS